jgi:hypothetical protein
VREKEARKGRDMNSGPPECDFVSSVFIRSFNTYVITYVKYCSNFTTGFPRAGSQMISQFTPVLRN